MNRIIERWRNALVCFSMLLLALPPTAKAQPLQPNWPSGPVRFVVPFPAGSAPDVLIRFVGVKLADKWGQPVVVDNRPGASGVIGMSAILAAPADGSVFGFVQGSAISVAPSLVKDVKYEFRRDFVPVTLAAVAPFMLVVPTGSPHKTLADLIAAARTEPRRVEVADVGRGTAPHLASALLGMQAGVEFLEVHYPGGAQAMQALMGGQAQMMIDSYNVVAGNVQGGRLRVLASMGDRIEPGLEQFALANKTVPGAVAHGWFAVIAKKGVPAPAIAKMNLDLNEVLLRPDVVAKSRELGTYPRPGTPEQLLEHIEQDRKAAQRVLDRLGIKPE